MCLRWSLNVQHDSVITHTMYVRRHCARNARVTSSAGMRSWSAPQLPKPCAQLVESVSRWTSALPCGGRRRCLATMTSGTAARVRSMLAQRSNCRCLLCRKCLLSISNVFATTIGCTVGGASTRSYVGCVCQLYMPLTTCGCCAGPISGQRARYVLAHCPWWRCGNWQ